MNNTVEKAWVLIMRKPKDCLPEVLLLPRHSHQDWTFTKEHIENNEFPKQATITKLTQSNMKNYLIQIQSIIEK